MRFQRAAALPRKEHPAGVLLTIAGINIGVYGAPGGRADRVATFSAYSGISWDALGCVPVAD